MSQPLSVDELERMLPAELLAQVADAVTRYGSDTVAVVLEGVLATVGPQRSTALTAAERALWADVGADFGADDAADIGDASSAARGYLELEHASIAGVSAFAAALRVTKSRVSQLQSAGEVYAWVRADGTVMFPRWQLHRGSRLGAASAVIRALRPGVHPLTVHRWVHTPNIDLELDGEPATPGEWLRTGGDPEPVARLAAAL